MSGSPPLRNLDPRLAAERARQLLVRIPWDGPRLDPKVLTARVMLGWLR